MKQVIRSLLIWGISLILGSCFYPTETLPPSPAPWLCCINADGTGFQKIKKMDKDFGTTGFWDMYMTKDDQIIFYGKRLWISQADSINPVPITPLDLISHHKPQLEFTRDGGTVYFAANRDLYKMKLSTNEVFKITETPVDFHYSEPSLSDDERYLTARVYVAKSDNANIVTFYFDLFDNSLGFIYADTWRPPERKTKIMTGLNKLFLENRDGFASVSLLDSTYTLHLPYDADWGNPFQTSADNRFILTERKVPYSRLAIAIDLKELKQYELGTIYRHSGRKPIKACKDANSVFYFDDNHLYKYDLDTHTKSTLLESNHNISIGDIFMIAPTWDGSKVYFRATVGY